MAKPRKPKSTSRRGKPSEDVIDAEIVSDTPVSPEPDQDADAGLAQDDTPPETGVDPETGAGGAETGSELDTDAKDLSAQTDDTAAGSEDSAGDSSDGQSAASDASDPLAPGSGSVDGDESGSIQAGKDNGDRGDTRHDGDKHEDQGGGDPEAAMTGETADLSQQADETAIQPGAAPRPGRGGFLPLVLGGALAAAIGFAVALFLFPEGLPMSSESDAFRTETAARMDAQEREIAQMSERLAGVSDRADPADALAGITAQLSALQGAVDAVSGSVDGFDARISELEKRPVTEAVSPEAIAAYEREVAALRETVATQRAEAEALQANAAVNAQQALARSALARIVAALDSGEPYSGALTDLKSVSGTEVPAALSDHADDGVPTRTQLEDGFPDAARAALNTARNDDAQADGGSRLGTFLRNQLGARSVTPRAGDDPDAVLSRAEAALREGRLSDAIAELDLLPETAQAEMAGWIAPATARRDALVAAEGLTQSLSSE